MNVFVAEQQRIKDRLQSVAYFADLPIVTEEKGTITEDVAQSLAAVAVAENGDNKNGIAIVLRTPEFTNSDPTKTGMLLMLHPKVSIYENVSINQGATGIGKPALDVLHAVLFMLHGFGSARIPRHAVTGGQSAEADGIVAYHVDVDVPGAIGGLP